MHGLILPQSEGTDPTDVAVRAEELGYDSVWMGELWGMDAFVQLTEIACRTEQIDLATGIVNVFSRSPAVLAMAAASVDRISDNRMTLGVGVSTPKSIEDLHGKTFERPVRRTHETVELVKAFTGSPDEPVEYSGKLFTVRDFPGLDADIPVYNAALGEANRRATGRVCDGWIPHNVPFPDINEAFETIATAAREAGREPESITVAPYVPAAVSETGGEARDAVRKHVAYYVGSGKGYKNAVGQRFPDQVEVIADAWQANDYATAADHVTDEMVSALGVAGTPESAREQLRTLQENPRIDRTLLTLPDSTVDTLGTKTIEALAPPKVRPDGGTDSMGDGPSL